MMKEKLLMLVLAGCLLVSACGSGPAEKPGGSEEGITSTMEYDFREYSNVNITGVDLASLSDEELAVLYAQAKYCQAMTEADIDTMRELVSAGTRRQVSDQ